jgi:hypothetical protein
MLILLNAPAATRKKLIAKKIFEKLNNIDNIEIEGYYGDLTEEIKIYDKNKKLVYQVTDNGADEGVTDLIQTEKGDLIYDKFIEFKKDIDEYLNDLVNLNSGGPPEIFDFFESGILDDLNCEIISDTKFCCNDIIEKYGKYKFEHIIVPSAFFSKSVIQELKFKLRDDLHVINLTRNPSVVFMMNTGYPLTENVDGINNKQNHTDINLEKFSSFKFLDEETFTSLLCSCFLSKIDFVQQEKFEDYLKNEKITIRGIDISLPEPLKKYNQYLTRYERVETLKKMKHILNNKMMELIKVNDLFSNVKDYIITDKSKEEFDNNFFNILGYKKINFDEMIKL